MKRYAFLDTEGNPVYSATPAIDDAYVDGQMYGEHLCKELPLDAFDDMTVLATYYYKDGWKTRAARPGAYYNWNNKTEKWVPNLELARTTKNSIIDNAHLAANQTSFTFNGRQIALTPLSRSNIDAVNSYVLLFNQLPDNWVGSWKSVNNANVPIANIDAWKRFYKAMVNHIHASIVKSNQLKTALAAATTIGEIEAIGW